MLRPKVSRTDVFGWIRSAASGRSLEGGVVCRGPLLCTPLGHIQHSRNDERMGVTAGRPGGYHSHAQWVLAAYVTVRPYRSHEGYRPRATRASFFRTFKDRRSKSQDKGARIRKGRHSLTVRTGRDGGERAEVTPMYILAHSYIFDGI